MLYSLKFLLFLINIEKMNLDLVTDSDRWQNTINSSVFTNKILVETIDKVKLFQGGLSLSDIESIIFFLVFVRFIILIFRYNLKTSTYITCIGIFAGYLWYRHLIDIITWYGQVLVKLPYLQPLGADAIDLDTNSDVLASRDSNLGSEVRWYNPGQLFYYAFTKGIIRTDPESGLQYYTDPISMIISSLDDPTKNKILPYYYTVYNIIIPRVFEFVTEFWRQLSGVAAYSLITRIGKRYCPYLIRWHWTFLLIVAFLEQIVVYFLFRVMYFQQVILEPKIALSMMEIVKSPNLGGNIEPNLLLQFNFLNVLLVFFVVLHLGSVLFGLFHAVWGQYFYFPFLVENTELHIGPRPKNSIYSGGQTTWQDEKRANPQRKLSKLWYGWFGSGTTETWVTNSLKQFVVSIIKNFSNLFKR